MFLAYYKEIKDDPLNIFLMKERFIYIKVLSLTTRKSLVISVQSFKGNSIN